MTARWTPALIDAAGCVIGLAIGCGIAFLLHAPLLGAHGNPLAMAGVGLCGGVGLALARRRRGRAAANNDPEEAPCSSNP